MKRSKKGPKPAHKTKFPPKRVAPEVQTTNLNNSSNLKTQNDSKMKSEAKKSNKKKSNNLARFYVMVSSTIFFICLNFIFSLNFQNLIFPTPSIFKETPFAAILDYYWGFSNPLLKQNMHLFFFAVSFYFFLYSSRCDPELSVAYCLMIILDPYFSGHFLSSNFLFYSLIISIFSFKNVFYCLTSFKRIDNKYRLIIALTCLLNGINLSIRFETISFALVQIISTFLKAIKKKKANKELLFAPIVMIIADLLVYFIFCLIFGFPKKIQLYYESVENFKDEFKLYSTNKFFYILAILAIPLYFVSNFKASHKIFMFSVLISSFLTLLLPIQINDYSIQIRLLYMQHMLIICFGIIICRPLYFVVSGSFLGCFVFASWILRYKTKPISYLE